LPVFFPVRMRKKTAKTRWPSSLFLVGENNHHVRGRDHLHCQGVRIQLAKVLEYQNSFSVLAEVCTYLQFC
jgi:hypothetical protein